MNISEILYHAGLTNPLFVNFARNMNYDSYHNEPFDMLSTEISSIIPL